MCMLVKKIKKNPNNNKKNPKCIPNQGKYIINQIQYCSIIFQNSFYIIYLFASISAFPAFFGKQKMTLPLYPEVSIIPKDGGTRSDGYSDAATKSATVRL